MFFPQSAVFLINFFATSFFVYGIPKILFSAYYNYRYIWTMMTYFRIPFWSNIFKRVHTKNKRIANSLNAGKHGYIFYCVLLRFWLLNKVLKLWKLTLLRRNKWEIRLFEDRIEVVGDRTLLVQQYPIIQGWLSFHRQ